MGEEWKRTSVRGMMGTLQVGLPKMSQHEMVRVPVRPDTTDASLRSILLFAMSMGPATHVTVCVSVAGRAAEAPWEGSSFTIRLYGPAFSGRKHVRTIPSCIGAMRHVTGGACTEYRCMGC